jgi:hypothetical protein
MRKLFALLLITLSTHAFSQFPGSFFDFQQTDQSRVGSLPFFAKMDDWTRPAVAHFYPSVLKTYLIGAEKNDIRFGIAVLNGEPCAKLEINASPVSNSIPQILYPAIKVYGGNYGLDVQAKSRGIYVHDDDVNNLGYGIYQTGEINLKNYFKNRMGIDIESPERMLDVAGDFRCTGSADIGTGINLVSADQSIAYPVYSNGTILQFRFPNRTDGSQPNQPQFFSLMTLTSDERKNQVEIAGNTLTYDLNVTRIANTAELNVENTTTTSVLNVGNLTTTKSLKMTEGAGNEKALISDDYGQGQWTDINPWLNKYWEFGSDKVDIYTHARNVGIGTTAYDDVPNAANRLTVYTNSTANGIYSLNQSDPAMNRFGIVANLVDPAVITGKGMPGTVNQESPNAGFAPLSVGISSMVKSNTDGIGLIGISSLVKNEGNSTVPSYGIKSCIYGIANSNPKYGIYSEIDGGAQNNRWAGYFKGGDVEIDKGSLFIGRPDDKRFCMQTQYWQTGSHSLAIFPSNDNGNWDPAFTSKGMTLYDNGSLSVNGNLFADGKMYAREIEVTLDAYAIPDYVFAPDYKILPLNELESYIKEHQHLPEIPSAEEIKANGANLGEMNVALLKKVEELTLYIIEMKKEMDELKSKIK